MNRKLNKLSTLVYSLMVAFMLLATVFTTPLSIFAQETEVSSVVTETIPTAPVEESEVTAETTVAPEEEISTEPVVESESTDSESTEEKSSEDEMASPAVNGAPKTLNNVFTTITFYTPDNKTMTTDPIVFVRNATYGMELNFDLSAYDHNLNNGDNFTFNVPAPTTLTTKTIELTDKDTQTNIATAVMTSAGAEQGGTVTITLKNLEKYIQAKGGESVVAVKGFVRADIKYETNTEQTLPIAGVQSTQSVNIKVQDPVAQVVGVMAAQVRPGHAALLHLIEKPALASALVRPAQAQACWCRHGRHHACICLYRNSFNRGVCRILRRFLGTGRAFFRQAGVIKSAKSVKYCTKTSVFPRL